VQNLTEVTAAIIIRDGKLLLCQRAKGKRCELLWEFPGGKVEDGETPEACLARECREELGIAIKTEHLVNQVVYEYADITVRIHFYICALAAGEPVCREHNRIDWFLLDEAKKLLLCPADRKMIDSSEAEIRTYLQRKAKN